MNKLFGLFVCYKENATYKELVLAPESRQSLLKAYEDRLADEFELFESSLDSGLGDYCLIEEIEVIE